MLYLFLGLTNIEKKYISNKPTASLTGIWAFARDPVGLLLNFKHLIFQEMFFKFV